MAKYQSPRGNNAYARSLRLDRWDQTKKPGYATYQNHIVLSRHHYHHGPKSCKQWQRQAPEGGDPKLGSICYAGHNTNGYWRCEFCKADHHGAHGLAFELGANGSVDLYYEQKLPEAERITPKAPLYKSRPVHYSQEYKHWRDYVRSEINRVKIY